MVCLRETEERIRGIIPFCEIQLAELVFQCQFDMIFGPYDERLISEDLICACCVRNEPVHLCESSPILHRQ